MKKERKVIDAHLHIFGHCEFGDRLAHGIGDEPTQEYLTEKYYGRLGIEKGIVMGNGPLEEQGKNLGEYFYYSAGLDEKDSWLKLEEIESHLQRKRCVGVKLYPGYYELYPNDKSLYPIYKIWESSISSYGDGCRKWRASEVLQTDPSGRYSDRFSRFEDCDVPFWKSVFTGGSGRIREKSKYVCRSFRIDRRCF